MYKNYKHFIVIIFAALSMGGCEDFVEVDMPQSQLTGKAVFEEKNTATATLLDAYASIRDEGMIAGTQLGCTYTLASYSDETDLYSSNINIGEFYQHTILSSNGIISEWWNIAYRQIFQLNSMLEGVADSTELPQEFKDIVTGEALFLRSLIYFYALNIWGDVPYITTTDYTINSQVGRDSQEWVMEQVSNDLDKAISLLPEDYPSSDRTRANRYTAMALQARVALYQQDWEKAVTLSSGILGNTSLYRWEENLDQVFKIQSPITIWQLQAGAPGRNTREASTFIINSSPPIFSALSNGLYTSFEPGDMRLTHWIGNITDDGNGSTYYFPRKYAELNNSGTSIEYSKVFRLAEVHLIRAEAYAHLGNPSAALADLNQIRQRAGLDNVEGADSAEILSAIVDERRHELFTEYGLRWFDLKRLGIAKSVLSPIKPNWKDTDVLFPIPESELSTNPNLLPQNNGYL